MHRALRAMESEAKARSPRRRRCERMAGVGAGADRSRSRRRAYASKCETPSSHLNPTVGAHCQTLCPSTRKSACAVLPPSGQTNPAGQRAASKTPRTVPRCCSARRTRPATSRAETVVFGSGALQTPRWLACRVVCAHHRLRP